MRETVNNHKRELRLPHDFGYMLLALVGLSGLIGACLYALKMRPRTGTVTGLAWIRAVSIERRVVRSGYASQMWVPSDAYNVRCSTQWRLVHHKSHEHLESYEGCNYDQLVWEDNGALVRQGNDNSPSWPSPLVDDTHRIVHWEQNYSIDVGTYHYASNRASLLQSLRVGQRVRFESNMLGEVNGIEALSH